MSTGCERAFLGRGACGSYLSSLMDRTQTQRDLRPLRANRGRRGRSHPLAYAVWSQCLALSYVKGRSLFAWFEPRGTAVRVVVRGAPAHQRGTDNSKGAVKGSWRRPKASCCPRGQDRFAPMMISPAPQRARGLRLLDGGAGRLDATTRRHAGAPIRNLDEVNGAGMRNQATSTAGLERPPEGLEMFRRGRASGTEQR